MEVHYVCPFFPTPTPIATPTLHPPTHQPPLCVCCRPQVVSASIAFATSLFWGGNTVVQDALLKWLETDETQAFLNAVSQKMQHSLTSLRNWKSELKFVTKAVPEFSAQANQAWHSSLPWCIAQSAQSAMCIFYSGRCTMCMVQDAFPTSLPPKLNPG